MSLATAPRPAFAVTGDIGFQVSWFSLAAEVRWDPPAGTTMADGIEVSTTLVLGALVPCAHYQWFAGCLVGELGRYQASATATGVTPDEQTTLYGLAGARVKFEIPVVADRLFVSLAANLLGAPMRPSVRLIYPGTEPQTEWESAAVTAGFGAGLVAAF